MTWYLIIFIIFAVIFVLLPLLYWLGIAVFEAWLNTIEDIKERWF